MILISAAALSAERHEVPAQAKGVLVKIRDKKGLEKIHGLAHGAGFQRGRFFENLGIQHYRSVSTNGRKNAEQLCAKILKVPGVAYCELDEALRAAEDCNKPETSVLKPEVVENLKSLKKGLAPSCALLHDEPGYGSGTAGLSDYWAQEYTGGDLLRAYLEQHPDQWRLSPRLVDILDLFKLENGAVRSHGDHVSSLISSPHGSSALPRRSSETIGAEVEGRSIESIVAYADDVAQRRDFPKLINHSMYMRESQAIFDSFRLLSENQVLLITAAGNSGGSVEQITRKAARELSVLVVGSTSFNGLPSDFSDAAPEVLVAAPSNNEALSFDKVGKPGHMGGTSGAAPQVTSALAAFEAISGHHLSKEEAIGLLRKTALKTVHSYDDPPRHGVGILNAYKIGMIALRLKEMCRAPDNADADLCIKRGLADEATYSFPVQDHHDAKAVFGSCFGATKAASLGCGSKKEALQRLRQEALLHPEQKELWEGIACVHREQGASMNSEFYDLIAHAQNAEDFESWLKQPVGGPSDLVIFHALTQNRWQDLHPQLVAKLLAGGRVDGRVLQDILTDPRSSGHPEWVNHLIQKGGLDEAIDFHLFSKPHWRNHPYYEKLLGGRPATARNIREALQASAVR